MEIIKIKKVEQLRTEIIASNYELNKEYCNIYDRLEAAKKQSDFWTTIDKNTSLILLQELLDAGYYISSPIKNQSYMCRVITWAGEMGLSAAIDFISKLNS